MPDQDHPSFDDMKLKVGERLQVSLRRNPKIVYYPTLIGYALNEYLLVKVPFDHGLSVPMLEGEAVVVRVFSGVAVYTFECMVESLQLDPHYHMYLTFPQEIVEIPLRDTPRIRVSLPVLVGIATSAEPTLAELTDLSISGALIAADTALGKPGDIVSIAFTFHVKPTNQEVHIATKATIRSCQKLHGDTQGIGVHFNDLVPADQVLMQHFLYEQAN